MAKAGAPLGNKNGAHDKPWANALRRALLQSDGKKLRSIADALVNKAADGDIQAIKELGDRLDGKPAQTIAGTGEDGAHKFEVTATWMKEAAKNRGW